MSAFLVSLSNALWGPPLIILTGVLGLYFTFKSRFFQVVRFPLVLKKTFGSLFLKANKSSNAFKAMCMALGGTIGVGNIAGVSAAIIVGGPGAVFWMWVSGFIGMIIKFCEVVLSVKYRRKTLNGTVGGPMYYMFDSGIKLLKPAAYIFAFFCVAASFFMGNIAQANTVAESFRYSMGLNPVTVSLMLALLIIPVVLGKAEKLKNFTGLFVPVMSLFYIIICLVVIGTNIERLPNSVGMIFSSAFGFKSAAAGVGGFAFSKAISAGFSKGLFTNEAGLGSAPIAHASNPDADPVIQGMWGIAEVFIDTIVVCSLTAFAVLGSDAYVLGTGGLSGVELTSAAFSEAVGKMMGERLLSICVVLFAFASMVAWNFYGRCALSFLTENKFMHKIYSLLFVLVAFLGGFTVSETVFALSDIFNSPLIIINIVSLAILHPKALGELKK